MIVNLLANYLVVSNKCTTFPADYNSLILFLISFYFLRAILIILNLLIFCLIFFNDRIFSSFYLWFYYFKSTNNKTISYGTLKIDILSYETISFNLSFCYKSYNINYDNRVFIYDLYYGIDEIYMECFMFENYTIKKLDK